MHSKKQTHSIRKPSLYIRISLDSLCPPPTGTMTPYQAFLACLLVNFSLVPPTEYCGSRAVPSVKESHYLNHVPCQMTPASSHCWDYNRYANVLLTSDTSTLHRSDLSARLGTVVTIEPIHYSVTSPPVMQFQHHVN